MDNRLLRLNLHDALSALADLLMPRVCVVCGRELTMRERFMCLPCSVDLPLTRYERWEHNPMADKYNARISEHVTPDTSSNVPPDPIGGLGCPVTAGYNIYEPYQRATALFFYRRGSGYDLITQALKYGRNFAAGRHFAAMLGERLRESPLFADIDLVVPVPLHWTRRVRRGYNQAEVIARELARALSAGRAGGPVFAPRLLRRTRRTRTQTRVGPGADSNLEARASNVAGAFAVRLSGIPTAHHILVIDDVFTTGATLAACHAALRAVFGPEVRISVATLAFAE